MQTKNILGIIFSILFIGAFAFAITWAVINQEKVKELMSGTGIYTEEDLNSAYEDGYNTALENKDEYDTLINSYRDTITTQTDEISKLNSQITLLTNNNKDYETQIASLESQKTELETNVYNLQTINSQNETTITGLNATISELQSQVKILQASDSDKTSQISALNTQISNLQTLVSQLQSTNQINSNTITSLNAQIISLNSQISELTYQIQNNGSTVTSLNNKIAQLEESIAYYENYIASFESGEQVVATFEFDGSVYNIQILNKNATASVTTPTSTDYVIFNYWTVNSEQIDLSTYQFTTNTKVVANVTYKYDVKFMVDNVEHNAQIVTNGTTATVPTTPTKSGYEFDGWSLNGVDIVDVTQQTVTANVTYYAVFTQLHTVTFIYEDDTIDTQTVRNGEYATDVDVEDTTNKIFNGWLLNGAIVDVSTYKILGTTVFTADITYKYNVVFKVDNADYDTQLIVKNGYATTPTAPTKDGYEFDGWSLNGVDIVNNITTTAVVQNTTYYAVFTQLHTVTFIYEDDTIDTQTVRNGEYAITPQVDSTIYKVFNGWTVNDSITNVSTYKITSATTFTANITYKYDVKFMVDNTEHNAQIVTSGATATVPTAPTKPGYEFIGWSLDGSSVVEVSSYVITQSTTYIALFNKLGMNGTWNYTLGMSMVGSVSGTITINNNSVVDCTCNNSSDYTIELRVDNTLYIRVKSGSYTWNSIGTYNESNDSWSFVSGSESYNGMGGSTYTQISRA